MSTTGIAPLPDDDFHYTPEHGSWLNIAEIELSVYSRSLPEHVPNEMMDSLNVEA